ncbi:flagellar assembly peptidoglycan hydrolase FlgJ [Alishewanella tabrizica]|uniref:Peptidoglycan hydrolase FlgJ n=1 Tax=Alishewanella tabrizica TaxID=671278 RepID=A0ABQ2WP63_9ALTE|nr:flagellar assembly peptidoglycan hydrolase FlgJ [Alishewanella tabrizica]GGW63523.1 flagellar rod assembly protein/muramidase FlgJ [Alishewanella tabrizica]
MNSGKLQHSYHDLNSLQQIRTTARGDKAGGLRQAAEQFEGIFFNMLLKSMRQANAAFEAEGLMNSQTTEFYRDMHDSQLASDLSQKGALGLADLLVQQLDPSAAAKPTQRPETLLLPGQLASDLALPQAQRYQQQTDLELLKAHAAQQVVQADLVQPGKRDMSQLSPLLEKLQQQRERVQAEKVAAEQAAAQQLAAQQRKTVEPVTESAEFKNDSPVEFIRSLLPAARKAASALGLDPLALIAQAALETGWGKRMIKTATGDNSYNLFGIKASRNWQGDTAVVDTLEYRQGVARKEQAKFRAYESPEQSLKDYASFISNSLRYQQAVAAAQEPAAYFSELQAAGYATDPNYAQKIMSVFKSSAFEQVRAELAASPSTTSQSAAQALTPAPHAATSTITSQARDGVSVGQSSIDRVQAENAQDFQATAEE